MKAVEDTGGIVGEPAWSLLLSDPLEIKAASDHWRRISSEMRERETLAASNGHALQRLVLAYVVYDRCSREVAEHGAVSKPKRGNPKSIARLSPHFSAMRETASDAMALEAELGLSPRRRSTATKAARTSRKPTGADRFLKPVA